MPGSDDVLICFFVFCLSALCLGCGLGGGPFYMPFFIWILNSTHLAGPMSKLSILGGALGGYLMNSLWNWNKKERKNTIHYELACLLEPCTLLGGIIGVQVNAYLSSVQIIIGIVFFLLYTCYITLCNALKEYEHEKYTLVPSSVGEGASSPSFLESTGGPGPGASDGELDPEQRPLNSTRPSNVVISLGQEKRGVDGGNEGEDRAEERGKTVTDVMVMVFLWGVHCVFMYFSGGPQYFLCGTTRQKWLSWGVFILILILNISYILYLKCWHYRNTSIVSVPSYMLRNISLVEALLSMLVAGVMAGSLGIGGGIIKSPMLIELGLNSISASSTSAFMLLFTASSTSLQFLLLGRIRDNHLVVLLLISSFFGAVIGVAAIRYAISKFQRQSFVSFLLSSLILASMICMVYVGVSELRKGNYTGSPKSIEEFCQRLQQSSVTY